MAVAQPTSATPDRSAIIITFPRPARRPPPREDADYRWLANQMQSWARKQCALDRMREAPASATPAILPETAEILAILRRIERRMA